MAMRFTTMTTAILLGACAPIEPKAFDPTIYGPSAWNERISTDAFDGEKWHTAIAHTTADSPLPANLLLPSAYKRPMQIHPRNWTHFCPDISTYRLNEIDIEARFDGEDLGWPRSSYIRGRVSANNKIVFIDGISKSKLDPVKELRIKIKDRTCGEVYIYYFDVSGAVPRP